MTMTQLPEILSVDRLGSAEMIHRWGDAYPTPPCANDWGAFRVANDPMGICNFMMPPFSTQGEFTAMLYVDRMHAPSQSISIGYTWYPDRVRRRCEMGGLQIETVTRAAVRQPAALIRLSATNPGPEERAVEIAVKVGGRMIHTVEGWAAGMVQIHHLEDHPETWRYEGELGAMCFASQEKAFSVQGSRPKPDGVEGKSLLYNVDLKPGETWHLHFVVALGESEEEAAGRFADMAERFDSACKACRDDWTKKIRAAFTPGSSVFSGHLPVFHTKDALLEKLYYTSLLGGLCCRRDNPICKLGTVYVTLMPDIWGTALFPWDTFLSDSCWAILDPTVLKTQVEGWLGMDLSHHLSLDSITGKGVGPWYAVNHTAIVHLAFAYLRYSGDLAWLDKKIGERSVIDHLQGHATRWHDLDVNGHGLADCGNGWNCGDGLTTWIHETPGFNAQWVGALRRVAQLRDARGETTTANALRTDAGTLLKNVLALYLDGKGYWQSKQPDGRLFPVCTLYDFFAVLDSIPEDLPEKTRKEMACLFETTFKTKTWVRGLSPWDDDAARSTRPDWGWNGAYGAFPALAAAGLYNIGHTNGIVEWLRNVAKATAQGPIGHCHLVEDIAEPFDGGALKSPVGGWTLISSAAFVVTIIESLFGVRATLSDGIQCRNQWGAFDPDARLENLSYQGKNYRVTRHGIEEM